jgi:hypothetical protein
VLQVGTCTAPLDKSRFSYLTKASKQKLSPRQSAFTRRIVSPQHCSKEAIILVLLERLAFYAYVGIQKM